MIEGQEGVSWEEWLALARAAEAHGLDGLFRSDHYTSIIRRGQGSLDAWTLLAALAATTTRIRLGTMVSPVTFRHPTVLARSVVTVDHISNGRVELGMGAGWYEAEHRRGGFPFPDVRTRFEQFAEQVEIVVRSWTEEHFDFDGKHYSLEGQTALPRPLQQPHPPLVLGGSARPRSAALAARFAQEYNTPSATPDQCAERRRSLDQACIEIGRDPASLPLSVMATCVIGANEADVDRRLRAVLQRIDDPRDVDVVREEKAAWLVGTCDELAERLDQYRAAGVSRVFLQHLDHSDLEAVALVGDCLVPLVS
ncbi:MAG: TIGR03560 family F420-dependent LLM class oxidoreductase [Thermoleophilia bacterium]